MQLYTLASGSSGNCALLTGGAKLLVDAGISCRKITTRLAQTGVHPRELDGILITHTHADHIGGLRVLLRRSPLPVYASEAAGEDLLRRVPEADGLLRPFRPGETFSLGGVEIRTFATSHDAPGSVGYRFSDGEQTAAVVTDLGYLSDCVREALAGRVDVALLEANHDPDWLRSGPYPYPLQERVLGRYGHLSNEACGELAIYLAQAGASVLVLGHLSRENNTPERARETVRRMLEEADCPPVRLSVAASDELCGPFAVPVRGMGARCG